MVTQDQVSIRDVAQRAGVALGTVSNVLNRPEKVAESTRERVLAAIEQLGFVRNDAARQLKAGKSRSIGFILLDVRNPFFTDVAQGAEQQAAAQGLSVLLANSNETTEREIPRSCTMWSMKRLTVKVWLGPIMTIPNMPAIKMTQP